MEADLSRVPLLLLTADRPPELHGIGANQTVEQSGLYGGAARWSYDVPAPAASAEAIDSWRETTRRAVETCLGWTGAPPGPVHLNLALREPLVAVDDGVGFDYDLGLDRERTLTTSGHALPADDVAGALRGVRNAVVVAGDNAGDPEPLVRWCERAGWPLIAEPHSNARRGPNALRAADALLRDTSFLAAHPPDLVLVAGRIGLSRPVQDWLRSARHIVLSPDGANWDTTRTAERLITARTGDLDAIDAERHRADPAWLTAWMRAAEHAARAIDAAIDTTSALNEPRVARDVAELLPSDAALVVASSMPIRDLDLVMKPRDDITVHANRGVSGIDGFVSTAQGIALAHGGRTVALCGDLSLLHDSNGLVTGGEPVPDVTYIVINNDGGGIFSLLPQGTAVDPVAFERLFGTPHGVNLAQLAAAYGIPHRLVTTADELRKAIAWYGGIRIVEIRSDRRANAELHAQLREITTGTA
jgi:2-succinyl-5-enolpyruvyl-6-hydroxy-3-cyclohexene-1-carboxylate synthase